ncbi:MAG TPA: polysaccharide biosynthesis/export family protein [Labilithrix sp.]|jgi:polysaccharide export outer membrane protein|nr:polysaccharide biosynthesis/export family protein [Labilithrix sp.]
MLLSRVLSVLSLLLIALLGTLVPACGRNYPPAPKLPEPVVNQQVGPGDLLEIFVVGEEKLPHEYEIGADGTLAFPYVEPIKVAGLEPREIANSLRKGLVDAKFLVSPQVQVKVKTYNSKNIQVIGQVAKQGPQPYQDGMTLVQAISAAGWFSPLADTNHVHVIRQTATGAVNAIVSVDAITDNVRPDIKLQQGDTIKVDQRLF